MLNIAIGAQVVLGAFTTGIAASTSGRQVICLCLDPLFNLYRLTSYHRPQSLLLSWEGSSLLPRHI